MNVSIGIDVGIKNFAMCVTLSYGEKREIGLWLVESVVKRHSNCNFITEKNLAKYFHEFLTYKCEHIRQIIKSYETKWKVSVDKMSINIENQAISQSKIKTSAKYIFYHLTFEFPQANVKYVPAYKKLEIAENILGNMKWKDVENLVCGTSDKNTQYRRGVRKTTYIERKKLASKCIQEVITKMFGEQNYQEYKVLYGDFEKSPDMCESLLYSLCAF